MGQMTIEKFKERFGGIMSRTEHPNKMILGRGMENAQVVKWCNCCRTMFPGEYRVDNNLWEQVTKGEKMYLCLPCLDQRVLELRGYTLGINDFPDAPVNNVLRWAHERGRTDA